MNKKEEYVDSPIGSLSKKDKILYDDAMRAKDKKGFPSADALESNKGRQDSKMREVLTSIAKGALPGGAAVTAAERIGKTVREKAREKAEASASEMKREARGMKKGGMVGSASKRADGCVMKGKTRGRMV